MIDRSVRLRPRNPNCLNVEQLEDRTAPAVYGVTLLSPPAGEPGETAAAHAGELRPISPSLHGTAVVETGSAADAVRLALTGAITATVGSQSASYPFGPDTAGDAKRDRLPYLVQVSGTNGRVWLEDMAGMTGSDWDYNDRSWRVTVRVLRASTGGTIGTLSYPQPVANLESFWYPAMAEGPDQMRLRETVTQVSDTEYRWDLEFTNTSTDSGSPTTFYHLGAAEFELPFLDLDAITRHGTLPAGWSAIEVTGPGTGELVRWETGYDFIMPGQSRTFTFYTAPLEVIWVPGIAGTPEDPSAGSADAVGAGLAPGELPKVIIADGAGNQVPDDPGLKVAKWQNAFKLAADGQTVEIEGPDGDGHDFIDRDPDRFNVWVHYPAKYNAGAATVDVKLYTENAPFFEIYNDPETTLRLVRHKSLAGWYWSDSQMLVSNEKDDNHLGVQLPAYLGADESLPGTNVNEKEGHKFPVADRTHRVALGGTVSAKYEYVPGKFVTDDAPVKIVKKLKLNIHIMTAGGAAVTTVDRVFADIRRMQETYAQVGIAIPYENIAIHTDGPPAGVDLAANGLDFDLVNRGISDEEKKLLADSAMATRSDPVDEQTGRRQIEVYYINWMGVMGTEDARWNENGHSWPLGGTSAARYADSVVLSAQTAAPLPHLTLAHECVHVLEVVLQGNNHFPYTPPPNTDLLDTVNLMVQGNRAVSGDTVLESRRLTSDQEQRVLSKRPGLLS